MDALLPLHATVLDVKDPVEGFIFVSGGEDHEGYNGFICKVIDRAEPDGEDLGPAFMARFGDGKILRVYGEELQPWYPT